MSASDLIERWEERKFWSSLSLSGRVTHGIVALHRQQTKLFIFLISSNMKHEVDLILATSSRWKTICRKRRTLERQIFRMWKYRSRSFCQAQSHVSDMHWVITVNQKLAWFTMRATTTTYLLNWMEMLDSQTDRQIFSEWEFLPSGHQTLMMPVELILI